MLLSVAYFRLSFGQRKLWFQARRCSPIPKRSSPTTATFRVVFPSSFPAAPPYVRVLRPRFVFRTGHVTIGGSICTEVLTNQGWSSSMTVESVLLSIRANLSSS